MKFLQGVSLGTRNNLLDVVGDLYTHLGICCHFQWDRKLHCAVVHKTKVSLRRFKGEGWLRSY